MRKTSYLLVGMSLAYLACPPCPYFSAVIQAQGVVDLEFSDSKSGEPVSARILFTKSAKRLSRPRKLLFAGDHWLAEQKFQLTPPTGEFEFIVQRGPEFNEIHGGFTIEPRAKDRVPIAIPRSIDVHEEHWFSGDHLSSLPLKELHRWQAADAVDMVVSTDSGELGSTDSGELGSTDKLKAVRDSRQNNTVTDGLSLGTQSMFLDSEHATLLIHGSESRTPKSPAIGDLIRLLEETTGKDGVAAELIRPWARDIPFLLATNSVRSVQILSAYNRPAGDDRLAFNKEPVNGVLGKVQLLQGKQKIPSEIFAPIDSDEAIRFKDARGVGKLSESIYWQMLETGLRIAPTAGSGFHGNDTHVGYNRVYVYSETTPDATSWWQSIAKGNTFVTNGPLLRANINGAPPGSIQTSYRSQSIPLDIVVSLSVRDPVDYVDVVFNGDTIYSAKLEDHYKRGEFPPIEIDKSGWLVIRVVTEHTKGYRFATTAPFYFVFDGRPRVSRKAVAFFQAWQKAAIDSIKQSPDQLKIYKAWIESSKLFWDAKLSDCTTD